MRTKRKLRTNEEIDVLLEENGFITPINRKIFDEIYSIEEHTYYPLDNESIDQTKNYLLYNSNNFRLTELDMIVLLFLQLLNYNRILLYPEEISSYLGCSRKALLFSISRLERIMKPDSNNAERLVVKSKSHGLINEKKALIDNWIVNYETAYDTETFRRTNFFNLTINDFRLLHNNTLSRGEFIFYTFLICINGERFLNHDTFSSVLNIRTYHTIDKYVDNLTDKKLITYSNSPAYNPLRFELPQRQYEVISHRMYLKNIKCKLEYEQYDSLYKDLNMDVRKKEIKAIKKSSYVYFIKNNLSKSIKIGYTTNVMSRLRQLQTSSSSKLILLGVIKGTRKREKMLHDKFSSSRQSGEWFAETDELLQYILNNTAQYQD